MSLSASEFYEAGLALPPSVRKDVALRLLESLEVADHNESVDDAWTSEINSRFDDIIGGKVEMIPGEEVFARISAHLDARATARHA